MKSEDLTFREACADDAELVYLLSNDPLVRSNSIRQDSIRWSEHLAWFSERIDDHTYKILLFFQASQFVGQVKFEIQERQATISISIREGSRGKGLSKQMIHTATDYLFAREGNVCEVYSFVKPSNTASIKSFIHCGFVFKGEEVIKDCIFQKYIKTRATMP